MHYCGMCGYYYTTTAGHHCPGGTSLTPTTYALGVSEATGQRIAVALERIAATLGGSPSDGGA